MAMNEDDLLARLGRLARPMEPLPTGAEPVLRALPEVRAVLWDVYGTLLISAAGDIGVEEKGAGSVHADAARAVGWDPERAEWGTAGERFHAALRAAHTRAHAAGVAWPEVDVRDLWRQVLGPGVAEADVARFAVEVEGRVNPTCAMPGLGETLFSLRQRGLTMGIVSNAQFYTPLLFPALTGRRVDSLGFLAEACIWSYEHGEGKPSPRLLAAALAALREREGLDPEQVLFVGNDARKDVAPAALAGCRTALFAGDARSLRQQADTPRPDLVLTSLLQLPPLLAASAAPRSVPASPAGTRTAVSTQPSTSAHG